MNQTNIPPVNQANRPLVSVGNGNQVKWGDFPVTQQVAGTTGTITTLNGDVTGSATSNQVVSFQGQTLAISGANFPGNGSLMQYTTATSSWTTVSAPTVVGQILEWNGGAWVQNGTTAPSSGDALVWNSSTSKWTPGGVTLNGDITGSSTSNQIQSLKGQTLAITGANFPGNGSLFQYTTATSSWTTVSAPTVVGQILEWNGGAWVQNATTTPANGNTLVWNSSTSKWTPGGLTLAGDVTGSSASNTVVKLQNYPVNVTGLSGSGGFMYYTSTGSQFVFSGSPTGAGSIMYWNGSGYVSTAPSSTGVLQWNSGSSTYSYVSVGGSTPNNDVWSSNPQTLSVSVSASSTTVNTVAFNTSATFTKFLITFNAAQTTNSSVADILYCDIRDGSSTGTLVAAYAVGTSTTSSRNIFSSSVNYVQATAASSTLYLNFYWKTAGTTGSLNYSMITVLGVS